MTKPVDLAALDPGTRRLAERGAQEAFGVSLDRLVYRLTVIAGETFDEQDLETLMLAGGLAERADVAESDRPA